MINMNSKYFIFIIFLNFSGFSQDLVSPDSLSSNFLDSNLINNQNSNYNKAPLLSAILPGLGQVYNKQYWKLPVIYGGYLLIGHYIKFNNNMYKEFRGALIAQTDDNELTINPYPNFSESSLERNMEYWRRNRDLLIIFTGVYYILNIVDAHVFSHLNDFDIGNDISFSLSPKISKFGYNHNFGISLKFKF